MAVIKVEGTIEKIYSSGSGFQIVEKHKDGDREYTNKYSIWLKNASGLAVGDKVTVTGRPSSSVFTGDDGQTRATISVNDPKVTKADDVF